MKSEKRELGWKYRKCMDNIGTFFVFVLIIGFWIWFWPHLMQGFKWFYGHRSTSVSTHIGPPKILPPATMIQDAQVKQSIQAIINDSDVHSRTMYEASKKKFDLGSYSEAITMLNLSIRMYPSDPEAYLLRAAAYEKTGNLLNALDDRAKAKQLRDTAVKP